MHGPPLTADLDRFSARPGKSLPANGFDNPLSRLLNNLLRRRQGNGD